MKIMSYNRFMAYRTLSIGDQNWQYTIGKVSVVIKDPQGKRQSFPVWEVKGVSVEVFERGQWKKTSDGSVTPKDIRSYIDKHLKGT